QRYLRAAGDAAGSHAGTAAPLPENLASTEHDACAVPRDDRLKVVLEPDLIHDNKRGRDVDSSDGRAANQGVVDMNALCSTGVDASGKAVDDKITDLHGRAVTYLNSIRSAANTVQRETLQRNHVA